MSEPIDIVTRYLAVSELDRNIVITAGAGTGKTTLLVNRLLHLLLGHKRFQAEESPILKIAAMTFTEKAAGDIKMRLVEELERIVNVINGNALEKEKKRVEKFLANIHHMYGVPYGEIERRARKSLEDMDKALIGTIHGFAAHILRLYPLESGVVPGFIVDDGDVFDELFEKEWTKWLEGELSLTSLNVKNWKSVLGRSDLAALKELAKRLSGFTIPFFSLPIQQGCSASEANHKSQIHFLIDPLQRKVLEIITYCEKPANKLLSQLNDLLRILDAIKEHGIRYMDDMEYDLNKNPSEAKTGWREDTFDTARKLVKECHHILKKLKTADEVFIRTIVSLISPFFMAFRQTYLSQGYVSFDGLLTLTRDLLQKSENRPIRDTLKKEFRAILVDEFQDTDPVQYEIVLFLSEALGQYSKDARKVILEPGKLFIVGDPKQSIYAFRRADIEAYEQVVKQVCGQDEILKLQENFRSHTGIVNVVNQLFDRKIMVEQQGLQPCYIPIHANRVRKYSSQRVEIILISDGEGEEIRADEAREAESEWIARWIVKSVGNEDIEDALSETGVHKLKYRDIALILRAFTQVRPYIEALKRYGIPYMVEGEKYFYTAQEILDFLNILRTIENPYDTIALVGVLRSPVVGLTDREIYELHINGLLDYRIPVPDTIDFKDVVEEFYGFLKSTHARAGTLPVSRLIAEIMDTTHIAEITAGSWHGEQKLANLWKLHQMAYDMEQSKNVSLKTFIDHIKTCIKEAREEGESPLSDETLDVVKILTAHKSKGLEFPVVILGNLHGDVRNDNETVNPAAFDWSTATTGVVVGKADKQIRNLHSISIEKKLNDRSWEEEKRVLYVAMTRARERLILMGSLKNDDRSYMGLITQSIRDLTGIQLNNKDTKRIFMGDAEIFVEHFTLGGTQYSSKARKRQEWNTDWGPFIGLWEKRKTAMLEAAQTPLFASSSMMSGEDAAQYLPYVRGKVEEILYMHNAEMIEYVCCQVLEEWDFQEAEDNLTMIVQLAVKWVTTMEKIKGRAMAQYLPDEYRYQGKNRILSPFLSGWKDECLDVSQKYPIQPISPHPDRGEKEAVRELKEILPDTRQIQDIEFITKESVKILSHFIGSEAYHELKDAKILGRGIPVLLKQGEQIVKGTLAILYNVNNQTVAADYTLDDTTIANLKGKTAEYRRQKELFLEAVKRCLKVDKAEFKLISLRTGKAVPFRVEQ